MSESSERCAGKGTTVRSATVDLPAGARHWVDGCGCRAAERLLARARLGYELPVVGGVVVDGELHQAKEQQPAVA